MSRTCLNRDIAFSYCSFVRQPLPPKLVSTRSIRAAFLPALHFVPSRLFAEFIFACADIKDIKITPSADLIHNGEAP